MTLQNWQAELAQAILNNDATTELVAPSAHISIYYHTALSNLNRALRTIYPMIVKLVGEDFFKLLTHEYIQQYPSQSGNLDEYGEYLSNFLIDYPPVKTLVYLPEVAAFEWACHRIMLAADVQELNLSSLSNLTTEQMLDVQFQLSPTARLLKCHYPILDIVDLCKGQNHNEINLHAGGVNLLILRKNNQVQLKSLSLAEFNFLSVLDNNQSLETALNTALTIDSHFDLTDKLNYWVRNNIIVI